jgi:beta-mannosidase
MSDAVVDYYFSKKLAYYYIKRSQKPFIIALDELYDRYQKICACNDTLSTVSGKVSIIDSETDSVIFESEFTADKNTTTVIGKLPIDYSEHKMLIIKWIANGEEGFNHYVTGFIPYDLEKYKAWIEKYNLRS